MSKTQKVSFQDLITSSDVPVLIDFWAPWCGPCRAMAPILQDLAKAYQGRLKVVKINVDDNPAVANRYRIQSIPTLILFHKGQILMQQAGAVSSDHLQQLLMPHLAAEKL